ncbi:MAG: hypothetical protein V1658_01810 [Candidatus Micrarchaeota archaeon]
MARGQAFETMMLVISVIVALAILGVLFSIIGGIRGVTGNPSQEIEDGFKKLHNKGIGSQPPKVVQFDEGQAIYAKSFETTISGTAEEILFVCDDNSNICGRGSDDSKPISIDDAKIKANQQIEVALVTCANEKNGEGPYYCVALSNAKDPSKATEACETACQLV